MSVTEDFMFNVGDGEAAIDGELTLPGTGQNAIDTNSSTTNNNE